jgi:hypothetical protein
VKLRTRKREPRPASLRRRFLASLVDGLAAICVMALAVAGVLLLGRSRGQPSVSRLKRLAEPPGRRVLGVCVFVLSVVLAPYRTPGHRLAGIRRVDIDTAGRITVAQAVLLVGSRALWQRLVRKALPRVRKAIPGARELPDMKAEIEALRSEHAGDAGAMQQALAELYRSHKTRPYASCLPAFALSLIELAIKAPMFRSPLNQDPFETLARTVLVRE